MTMMTRVGSERVQDKVTTHGFWFALAMSYCAILLAFTTIWQLCIIPPAIAGALFIKHKVSIAWWSGFIGVAAAWFTLVVYFISTQPAMQVADLIMAIIIGSTGLGWVAIVLTIVIGACLGGFGGVLGFAIQAMSSTKRGTAEAKGTT
jgi:hypothetical protein